MRASAGDHVSQQEGRIADRLDSKSIVGIAAPVIANAIIGGHGFVEGERAARVVSADRVRGNIHYVIDIGAELEGCRPLIQVKLSVSAMVLLTM